MNVTSATVQFKLKIKICYKNYLDTIFDSTSPWITKHTPGWPHIVLTVKNQHSGNVKKMHIQVFCATTSIV